MMVIYGARACAAFAVRGAGGLMQTALGWLGRASAPPELHDSGAGMVCCPGRVCFGLVLGCAPAPKKRILVAPVQRG